MEDDNYFARIRARLVSGELSDIAFGALLPPLARAKSPFHWTPLAVARRAARRFAERGTSRVLDVGCGPGKFCVAASLAQPEIDFCGVDLSVALTRTAKEVAARLRLSNVEFRAGDALEAPWHDFDGFYFFNPFSGNSPAPPARSSWPSGCDELLRVAELLGAAQRDATVITYHGLGGLIPSSYDLLSEEPVGSGLLRVWRKTRARTTDWYHLDYSRSVLRIPRKYVERTLGGRKGSGELAAE